MSLEISDFEEKQLPEIRRQQLQQLLSTSPATTEEPETAQKTTAETARDGTCFVSTRCNTHYDIVLCNTANIFKAGNTGNTVDAWQNIAKACGY